MARPSSIRMASLLVVYANEEYMSEANELSTLEIPVVDGKAIFPRYLTCECGHQMRHRPGHIYGCPECQLTFQVDIDNLEDGQANCTLRK